MGLLIAIVVGYVLLDQPAPPPAAPAGVNPNTTGYQVLAQGGGPGAPIDGSGPSLPTNVAGNTSQHFVYNVTAATRRSIGV